MQRPVIKGYEDTVFDLGIRIKHTLPIFDFVMDEECQGELLDYVWTMLPGVVISSKFKAVLDNLQVDNVDYYPVRIVNDITKEVRSDFIVANIIGAISCMDSKKSKFTTFDAFPDKIQSIEDLRLDYEKVGKEKIFRLGEETGIVIVHDSIKVVAEKSKVGGMVFIPVEGYST